MLNFPDFDRFELYVQIEPVLSRTVDFNPLLWRYLFTLQADLMNAFN